MLKLFSRNSGEPGVVRIDARQAKAKIDEDSNVVILDVRTSEEYAESHIPNAKLLPLDSIGNALRVIPDKDKTYLVYCLSGSRSAAASKQLVKMGYKHVYNFGGITSWPYKTVRGK